MLAHVHQLFLRFLPYSSTDLPYLVTLTCGEIFRLTAIVTGSHTHLPPLLLLMTVCTCVSMIPVWSDVVVALWTTSSPVGQWPFLKKQITSWPPTTMVIEWCPVCSRTQGSFIRRCCYQPAILSLYKIGGFSYGNWLTCSHSVKQYQVDLLVVIDCLLKLPLSDIWQYSHFA